MSRIGRRSIAIPAGVKFSCTNGLAVVEGPKGKSELSIPEQLEIVVEDNTLSIKADYVNDRVARRLMGTVNSLLKNMVTGVSVGFEKVLRLVGVGYRARVDGNLLELQLAYSNPVVMDIPPNVSVEVRDSNVVVVSSHDNVLVGQFAAQIRSKRPPEPYKGKGVLYDGEKIRRKAGKSGRK